METNTSDSQNGLAQGKNLIFFCLGQLKINPRNPERPRRIRSLKLLFPKDLLRV